MEIIYKSFVSAIITAIILLISKYFGPRLAGAIAGIPIVYAISYVLITMEAQNKAKSYLVGGIYGAIAMIFFIVILILFNWKFPNTHWINFAAAYILCLLLAIGMVQLTTK